MTGPFSKQVIVLVPDDVTPPPAPSTPAVMSRLGMIHVGWDGRSSSGTSMPSDLDHVRVWLADPIDPSSAAIVDAMRAAETVVIGGQPYNAERQVWLTALDRSGNESAPSTKVSVTTQPLVNTDVVGQIIAGANIVDGTLNAADKVIANSVTSALVQTAAINAGHLAANAVTTPALAAGSVTSGKLESILTLTTRLVAGNSGGARVELNSSGLQAFNAAGQQTVSIASATGSATIVGQLSSGFSGRRIVFNPNGTSDPEIRFLPDSGVADNGARMYLQNSGSNQAFLKFEGPQDGQMRSRLELGSGLNSTFIGQLNTSDYKEDMAIYMGTSYTGKRISFTGRVKEPAGLGVQWGMAAIAPGSADTDGSVFSCDYEGLWYEPMYAIFTPTAGNPVGHAVTLNEYGYFNGSVSIGLSGSDRVTWWSVRL
ncbi:hypothetical protein [Nonomuraea sp. NPDC050786]|uniref:hypothetical protein n=1 Tax=Nonomuraea sp. NPDC050786 TaxID=3154840 RepID=UPI0033C5E25C